MARKLTTSHPWRLVALLVVAVLGLSLVSPAANSQVVPGSALATQFFNAVGGESPFHMLSADAVLHTPEGTYTGVTGPAQFGEEFGASFSNVQFWLQSTSGTADGAVLASFRLTGINTGSYRGLTANCAGISVQGVALFDVEQRTVWTEDWVQPNDVRPDLPQNQVVSVVTEQWVSYDANAIASQIGAFNALDSNIRPGCGDSAFEPSGASSDDAPPYEPAPSCGSPNECLLPY